MGLGSRIRDKWAAEGPLAVLRAAGPHAWMQLTTRLREFYYAFNHAVRGRSEVRIWGFRIDLDAGSFDDRMVSAVRRGRYEHEEAQFVRQYLPEATDVIELGAGIGVVSGVISSQICRGPTHVAVEADPEKIPILESTREINGFRFHIEHAAYGVEGDTVSLYPSNHPPSASTHEKRERDDAVKVRAVTLEELSDTYDIDSFALVLDIEGIEFDLIDEEIDRLEANCSLMVVEFHDFTVDSIPETKRRLAEHGFELVDGVGDVYVFEN